MTKADLDAGDVKRMIAQIERWAEEFSNLPGLRVEGSQLAQDDAVYLVLQPSQVVYHSLATAITHLHMYARWLKLTDHEWNPCLYTVLRTALMGSCQALYIIGPDERAERQARAIRIMLGDVRNERAMLNDAELVTPEPDRVRRLTELAGYMAQAQALNVQLGKSVTPPSTTAVIAEAVRLMPNQGAFETMFLAGVDGLWRGGSAHAHASPLLRFMTLEVGERQDRGDGTEVAFARVVPEHVYGVSGAAGRIFFEARRRYAEAQRPVDGGLSLF